MSYDRIVLCKNVLTKVETKNLTKILQCLISNMCCFIYIKLSF